MKLQPTSESCLWRSGGRRKAALGLACVGLVLGMTSHRAYAGSNLQPRMGQPLNGLTQTELDRFLAGRVKFDTALIPGTGLGPIFNQSNCGTCHTNPLGGSGSQRVTRFGQVDKLGNFDPLASLGGSLLQALSISPECAETVPSLPDVITAFRVTPSTLGFGLIEAIDDPDIQDNADTPPSANVSGRVHMVQPLEGPPGLRVGRFGWKAQVATVLTFSGDAALNEMGLTNDLVLTENAPNGNLVLLAQCDPVPTEPEDVADIDGFRFIDRVTDFQRFLAAPPQTPKSGMTGESIFAGIGCTDCHIPTFVTRDHPSIEDAIRNKVIHPYSDFLLHDMGVLFDGIVQGDAEAGEIRTPALWGLRVRDPMRHDGEVASGTFETRVTQVILDHGQLGSEAKPSVDQFIALSPSQKSSVIAFLDSLGRAEFDQDGNNAIDGDDFAAFVLCFNGGPYTADDPCAISDLNQDGLVDCVDWTGFQQAWTAPGSPPPFTCDGPIPTVSQWGLVVMGLLTVAAGTIMFRRRAAACT